MQTESNGPGCHNAIFNTLYQQQYSPVWNFQPLAVGNATIVASIVTSIAFRIGIWGVVATVGATVPQLWLATIVVAFILGLAYLINYSGMAYTLGLGVASVGFLFPTGVGVPRLGRGLPVWK